MSCDQRPNKLLYICDVGCVLILYRGLRINTQCAHQFLDFFHQDLNYCSFFLDIFPTRPFAQQSLHSSRTKSPWSSKYRNSFLVNCVLGLQEIGTFSPIYFYFRNFFSVNFFLFQFRSLTIFLSTTNIYIKRYPQSMRL